MSFLSYLVISIFLLVNIFISCSKSNLRYLQLALFDTKSNNAGSTCTKDIYNKSAFLKVLVPRILVSGILILKILISNIFVLKILIPMVFIPACFYQIYQSYYVLKSTITIILNFGSQTILYERVTLNRHTLKIRNGNMSQLIVIAYILVVIYILSFR